MSTSQFREPTNDELWAQPPATVPPPVAQGLVPAGQAPVPAPIAPPPLPVAHQKQDRTPFILAIVSIALGIPLTAIASGTAGLPGLIVAWIGIVLVNFFYDRTHRS
jgi:hypothetical protein